MKRTFYSMLMLLAVVMVTGCQPPKKADEDKKAPEATGEKVKLDFHIMSKCPFGVKVLQAVTPVIEKMGDRVDFNVYYIGREKDGEITSMHGEQEIKGDILQLCAKETSDQEKWLEFLKCQNENWRKIPEGWEDCAKSAKIDAAKMKSCSEGEQGKKLLKESINVSNEKKATGSPTIFLDGESYRGGRSESSFGRAICGKMKEPKAAYCKDIPAPVKVPVTVVADKRCTGRGCDPKRFLSFVSHTFEGAEIKELDYSDPEGKALFEKSGQQFLPIAVFGAEIEKEEAGYNRLKRRLTKVEGGTDMVYPLGRTWDPSSEICDDGQDNTGNGQVDCDDDSCKGKKVCREETKNKLDIFIMSQCPYGVRTVDAMKDVLDAFGKDKKLIDFELNYIGQERNGELTSMHGPDEVAEDIRQLCAQKIYGKKYKYMDYVFCRNKDYRNKDWEACAKDGIKAADIKKCAEGEEGQTLLRESFQKAADLGISGSPAWLLNNRFDMNARNPEAIKKAFCGKNPGIKGCEKELSSESDATPAGACGGGPAPAAKKPAKAADAKADAKPADAKAADAKPAAGAKKAE